LQSPLWLVCNGFTTITVPVTPTTTAAIAATKLARPLLLSTRLGAWSTSRSVNRKVHGVAKLAEGPDGVGSSLGRLSRGSRPFAFECYSIRMIEGGNLNRRKVMTGLAAAIANALRPGNADAAGQKKKNNGADLQRLHAQEMMQLENEAIERTKMYENRLRDSLLLKTGTPNEVIQLLREGMPTENPNDPRKAGPNDSPVSRDLAPRLFPRFDERAEPSSSNKYPGLELRFGTLTTNAVRISKDSILRPDSLRPAIVGGKGAGLIVERIQLRRDDANVGTVRLNEQLTESDIDCRYAVGLHTSFSGDEGPWLSARRGRVDFSGYILCSTGRPALANVVETSIQTFIAPESREALRAKMKDSVLMIGNVFEWKYLLERIERKETGVGQPVYVRRSDGSFEFCGIIQDLLPLGASRSTSLRTAVAYVVATPEKIRKTLGNRP